VGDGKGAGLKCELFFSGKYRCVHVTDGTINTTCINSVILYKCHEAHFSPIYITFLNTSHYYV